MLHICFCNINPVIRIVWLLGSRLLWRIIRVVIVDILKVSMAPFEDYFIYGAVKQRTFTHTYMEFIYDE